MDLEPDGEDNLISAMRLAYNSFPAMPIDDYSKCTQCLPHAITTLEHIGRKNLTFRLRWDLQMVVGIALDAKADYATAMEWYERALDGYEKTLGMDHPSALDTAHNMAVVFDAQGEYGKALEWFQRALDGREKTLGMDQPDPLSAPSTTWPSVFGSQGEYGKALEWYQRALDGREKTLGMGHPSTLATVNNMGLVFDTQGEYGKALEWYQRALDG
jgi:tetratricopeptide (TPR) repeat protein